MELMQMFLAGCTFVAALFSLADGNYKWLVFNTLFCILNVVLALN